MEYLGPDHMARRHTVDEDYALHDKIMASGKYIGKYILIVGGKIVVQEEDEIVFAKKAKKYDGKLRLYVHIPSKVHPLHPLLGLYSE